MNHEPQTIRRGRKFAQVLQGAREVFMEHGYEGAGVDEIARVAGVSKATLYSYFPDKRLLFMEVVRQECLLQADAAIELYDANTPVREALLCGARRIVAFFLSDFGQGVTRMCLAEAARFPELGRRFYASGPQLARERIGDYLRAACERGALRIDDIDLAADQFQQLCQADLLDRSICGVQTSFTEAEITRVVEGAVDMFLARYAPRA